MFAYRSREGSSPGGACLASTLVVSLTISFAMATATSLIRPAGSLAQEPGSIRGIVLSQGGEPAADAVVRLVGLGRVARTEEDGSFLLQPVAPGTYLLEVESQRAGYTVERVTVSSGEGAELEIVLSRVYHGEEIVVSAAGGARRTGEAFQATNVLSGSELRRRTEPSLGETLKDMPGINSTYFGPGSSRPVIRGLGGDRVRVLEGGVGTGDASSTSPDHAVSVEPLAVDRIEVIRGPATLLYGSSAIGGAVNVIDRRIPSELPGQPLSGRLSGAAGAVADERNGSLELDGAVGRLAWHLNALVRDTDDYDIPGFAEVDHEEDGEEGRAPSGTLPNSFVETRRGSLGLSYVDQSGYVGVSFSGLDTEYGIPGHEEEDGEGEEGASIDLQQRRLDVEGAWNFDRRFLQRVKARFGLSDYRHFEIEDGEVGTRFDNDEWELRVEARHRVASGVVGTVGAQLRNRDFSALGEEAFVPPTETDLFAIFLFEEFGEGAVRVQVGGRFESQEVTNASEGVSRRQDALSASLGLTWRPTDRVTLALSGARSAKIPAAEELFSEGPHLATRAFELGDPDLGLEVGHSLDASARLREGPVQGSLTAFANRYDDFIFQRFTGEEEDELPVLIYAQEDALFVGYEAEVEVDLFHHEAHDHHLVLEAWSDYVRAELTGPNQPLPRIPPLRLGSGLRYEGGSWSGRVGLRRITGQDRAAPLENPTPGYTMLDAFAGYRFFTDGLAHEISLRGTNLTDQEARSHVSFLKDVAPLPGREIRLTYSVSF